MHTEQPGRPNLTSNHGDECATIVFPPAAAVCGTTLWRLLPLLHFSPELVSGFARAVSQLLRLSHIAPTLSGNETKAIVL